MKILSWNCRGLAQSSTIRSLRAMIRKSFLDIIFLSETKFAPHIVSSILTPLGFTLVAQAPPSGSRGGLLLAWKTDVKLTPVFISNAIITTWCYSDSIIPWMISFVYGPPYQKHTSDFWNVLAQFGEDHTIPWLCIGDFNDITSQSDKFGGRPMNCSFGNPFSSFMDSFGMIDLGFSGNPYT